MKVIAQLGLISALYWVCLCVEKILPFAMPASILGMILLLALLILRLIKVEWIRELTDFVLGNLPLFYVPVVVSIIKYLDVLRDSWLALVAICVATLFITFAATAYAVRLTIRLMERGKRK